MMRRYEALILATPEITQDEAKLIETEINKVVAEQKGMILSFERWGKYKLAYSVGKHDYGIYYLTRFELPNASVFAALEAIKTVCAVKLHTIIMRHVVCALDPRKPLTYQRPRSLEETPVESEIDINSRDGRPEMGSYQQRSSGPRERNDRGGERKSYHSNNSSRQDRSSSLGLDNNSIDEIIQ